MSERAGWIHTRPSASAPALETRDGFRSVLRAGHADSEELRETEWKPPCPRGNSQSQVCVMSNFSLCAKPHRNGDPNWKHLYRFALRSCGSSAAGFNNSHSAHAL